MANQQRQINEGENYKHTTFQYTETTMRQNVFNENA